MTGKASITVEQLEELIERISQFTHLTWTEACREIGRPSQSMGFWRDTLAPRWQAEYPDRKLTFPRFAARRYSTARDTGQHVPPAPAVVVPGPTPAAPDPAVIRERVRAALKRQAATLEQLSSSLGITPGQALDACQALVDAGANVREDGGVWVAQDMPTPAFVSGRAPHRLVSTPDHKFRFGVVADSHLGSKYERLDSLNSIYDRFAREGITHVYHCGNWIEGEARFNRTDVKVHGMDAQLEYLARHYPCRPGIVTYAVTGDDHEGWYAQREGIDIGKRAEQTMRAAGREDWVDLGYMEAHVHLVNASTQKVAIMAVVHPGGGSAYADSYVVQKIIESLDGGEKPAIALYGHYHKMLAGDYRNVFWVLVPSTKDQDVFMRKKRIRSVVGGGIVEVHQHPHDGALHTFKPWLWRYFNKGYYEGRWSHSGDVNLPDREPA